MAAPSRTVPRFLPTLTEVVHLPVPVRPASAIEPAPEVEAEAAAISESVQLQVDADLEELFRGAVSAAMLEQVDAIAARIRGEIEPTLRQAVADMVAHEIAARRHL